ncbi:flagellar biosynthesis protein FlgM, partial [Ruegeria pomeroyi]|nr:flagellar biosynthesis protein FlgM [Ruegeria pomeroyi]
GEGGNDTFVFSTALGAGNIDTIRDYSVVDDQIELSVAIFDTLSPGALAAGAFAANTSGTAQTADHRIIYDTDDGGLFYDADGDGAGAAQQFATLTTGLALTNSDFDLV